MEQHSLKCLHLVSWQKNGIQGEAGSVTEKDGKKKYDTLAARRGDSPERENQAPQRLAEVWPYHRQATCGREDR